MTAQMVRRGPDAEGFVAWDRAHLAHRRLSILDLSDRGRQPMVDDSGAVGVIFNGAIYNFVELRSELRGCGRSFRSETDTEVLLHGYLQWGVDGLVKRLEGMFAFAIWDDRSHELFLVRDRLGVKPMFYCAGTDTVSFASTANALRAVGLGGELNSQAVGDFLEWGVVPEQRSIWSGLSKLPPATIARWHAGSLDLSEYWRPPAPRADSRVSFDDAVDRAEGLLVEAVRRRTRSDVPMGALLSGGVDSALVCWALREVGADVSAYTFSAPGEPEDESSDALDTARELGIRVDVLSAPAGTDEIDHLIAAFSEPFACGSAIGMLRLSRAVRDSATVLLTGDGGDDVFLGYPHHRHLLQAQRVAGYIPASIARSMSGLSPSANAYGPIRRVHNFGRYAAGGLGAFLQVRNSFRFLQSHGLLGSRLDDVVPASHMIPVQPGAGRSILPDYLDHARQHQFVSEYLMKVDGATMYHSLEARSPFLDHQLWEYAASLPYQTRLHQGRLKAVLREVARRRISERVARGRKRGFEVPVGNWLAGPWRERAADLLSSQQLKEDGWLNGRRMLEFLTPGANVPIPVWHAVVLGAWLAKRHEPSLEAVPV